MTRIRQLLADTRPLRNEHFRRLWSANIVTVVGAQLTVVAVPAQIYAMTHSSALVGLTGLFGLVPLVVFGLWGGALADVVDRRTLLIATTTGLITTSGVLCGQAITGVNNVWVLLGLFSTQQAFFAVNQPTRSAILPKLLPIEQLPAANSLNMTVSQAGAIAGPLLGGALIPVLGFGLLYLLDTVSLFATLGAVLRLPELPVSSTASSSVSSRTARHATTPGWRAVVDGLAYLRHHPVLLMSFVVDLIAMILGMPRALFPEIANVTFGGPPTGGIPFAVLFAAIPTGAVLGGVFSGWVSRVDRQGLAVAGAIVVWGAAMAGFGITVALAGRWTEAMLAAAGVMLVIGGAADMASAAFRTSMLQGSASDTVRGRLQGVFIVVVVGGPRIGDTAHGLSAARFGTALTVGGGGILVIVVTLTVCLAVPGFVRYRLSRSEPPS